MARTPKPTSKASLSIYSTRKENSGMTGPSLELTTDGSPSRLSSSQSTMQDSPSDEMVHRRASNSSSLSSYESTDNTSFITLKYSPPTKKAIDIHGSALSSVCNSPSKSKIVETSTDDVNGSRTRSARNRKLTGKALDLAVSGKLYKSEKLQSSKCSTRSEDRTSESLRGSPAMSLQDHDESKGAKQTSRSQSRERSEPLRDKDITPSKTLVPSGLGIDILQDTASPASAAQAEIATTNSFDSLKPVRKKRKLQSTTTSPDLTAGDHSKAIDAEITEDLSNDRDQNSVPKSLPSSRGAHKSHKGRDSLAGQASLRSTRQRVSRLQPDDTKDATKSLVTLDTGYIDSSMAEDCDLSCLDEADIFLTLAEYIVDNEDDDSEEEKLNRQSSDQHEKIVSLAERFPNLKTYCRCRHRPEPADATSS